MFERCMLLRVVQKVYEMTGSSSIVKGPPRHVNAIVLLVSEGVTSILPPEVGC